MVFSGNLRLGGEKEEDIGMRPASNRNLEIFSK